MDSAVPAGAEAGHVGSGRLLSGPSLLEALQREDHIFRNGSWETKQIEGAGYELRLAGNFLVYPETAGSARFRTVGPDDEPIAEFTLAPGDSALVSTQEKFSLDFDISVLIGPKFRWAARGLLVLHGMVAHPGYGREETASGKWIPKADERLYVVIANVGPQPIPMRVGDPIGYVQFFEVEPPAVRKPVSNIGFDFLRQTLFNVRRDSADPGLAYFRNVRDLGESVADLKAHVDAESKLLNGRVDNALNAVDRVRNTTDNVVVFGVFLISATILGVVLTTLVETIKGLPSHLSALRATIITILVVLYGLAVIIGVIMVARSAQKQSNDQRRGRRSPTPVDSAALANSTPDGSASRIQEAASSTNPVVAPSTDASVASGGAGPVDPSVPAERPPSAEAD